MEALQSIDPRRLGAVHTVLTDIDDTLTRDGRLLSQAFLAMWRLSDAGIRVIPVTGRPAGWCDAIVRQWPVAAVIGENGAFAYYLRDGLRRELVHPEARPGLMASRADELLRAVRDRVPEARLSSDQDFRRFDLAVDYAEDEPALPLSAAETIAGILEDRGAVAKISSIHVNAWFGEYSKKDMARRVLEDLFGLDGEERNRGVIFVGDSPNDAPMFEAFPLSVAVANVTRYEGLMEATPAWVTGAPFGAGFAELAAFILMAKSSGGA